LHDISQMVAKKLGLDQRLVGGHFRGRVLQRHARLCRQGGGALCVVRRGRQAIGCDFLFEKTSQSFDFHDDILCQDLRYQRRLWRGTDFVEMTGGFGLGHELSYAVIERAFRHQISTSVPAALIVS